MYFRPFRERPETVPPEIEHARRGIASDPTEASGYAALAHALLLMGQHSEARAAADRAVSLDPNSAWAFAAQGLTRAFGDRPREGIDALMLAMRLSPFDPLMPRWQHHLARASYLAGDYAPAVASAQQLCQSYPDLSPVYRTLIAALGQLRQEAEAQRVMSEALERFGERFWGTMLTQPPELSLEAYEHMLDGYRQAGVLD